MISRLKTFSLGAFLCSIMVLPAHAQVAPCTGSPCYNGSFQDGITAAEGNLPLQSNLSITDIVLKIIGEILNVILIIAVLAIIIAGVYLITSNGEEGQKDKAKKIVIYVAAGIILILFARAIVLFINNAFT